MRSASVAGIHHADVGAARLRLQQRQALRRRHAHRVGVGAQDEARARRELDRVVDAPDRQHADRAAGTVDHVDVGRQQVLEAVARDRVRVAAAEFHQVVAAPGPCFAGDRAGERARELAVAEFVDVLHAAAASNPIPASAKRRSVRRGFRIELGERVADVDDHVVAGRDVVDQRQRDLLAARRRGRSRAVSGAGQCDDARGNGEAHRQRLPLERAAGDPRLAEREAAVVGRDRLRFEQRRCRRPASARRRPRARIALRKQPPPAATAVRSSASAARVVQSASAATSVAWNSAAP